MLIKCKTTFRDEYDTFEKDEEYEIPDLKAVVFVAHGWAEPVKGGVAMTVTTDDITTLEVQSITHNLGDSNG